jgi:hypothetical protein
MEAVTNPQTQYHHPCRGGPRGQPWPHGLHDIPHHDLEEETSKRPCHLATWAGRVDDTGPTPYRDDANSFVGIGNAQANGFGF